MRRLLLFAASLAACSGGTSEVSTPKPDAPAVSVPANLVQGTWQVRLAVDAARAPFEGRQGFIDLFKGDRAAAFASFAAENDGPTMARVHAEYASLYRQAALLAAHATVQVYGSDAQPSDPAETAYLLGVSGVLLGDEAERARLGGSLKSTVKAVATQDAAWKKWLDSGAAWPPDAAASTGPGAPQAAPTPGQSPDAGTLPHYQLPERGEATSVDAGDPGTLWALARWHEAAALAASPASADAVRVWIDPWRLPAEPRSPAAPVTIPDTFLFMSEVTSQGDALFLSDLERDGWPAVAAHQGDSAYAAILASCAPEQKVQVDCVLDQAAALGDAIEKGMETAAGHQDSFHRPFADLARVGVLRAADRAAFKLGDTDAGGRLRINALDKSTGAARDSLFLLSVAAWDAGNRNSVRAEELVHGLLTEVPGLEAARLPLDALHIRLSRNAAPGRPSN